MRLPREFIERTSTLLGKDEYEKLETALEQDSPTSIRLNARKAANHSELMGSKFLSDQIPWSSIGYYLSDRLTFTFDPLFHAGCYYVQEASSMFIEQVVRKYVDKPVIALDLCAAPGGKSTHLRSLLPDGSLLVANEVIRNRSQILLENLVKWGHPDIMVTNNDPSAFSSLTNFFDVILADVPCSGEGMFRKDPGAVEEWSTDNVDICWQRQRRIIADIWDCLNPGGILIYSTCTYNVEENEKNVCWIRDEYDADVLSINDIPQEWGITGNLLNADFPVYRFLPHKTKGEGLFMAVLRKPQENSISEPKRFIDKTKKKAQKPVPVPNEVKAWLCRPDNYVFEITDMVITAFSKRYVEEMNVIRKQLKVLHGGIVVGEIKGKDIIPAHSLVMNSEFDRSAFLAYEVTYEQAISYLRKEAITLNSDISKGYVLLTYKHVPIGFVKNIGNRANNLYPNEWRIRSGYLPDEIKCL